MNNNGVERREFSCQSIELRANTKDEKRVISGYAAVFNSWSQPIYGWFKERILPGAFDETDFTRCIACFNHNRENLLARTSSGTLTLKVDERGLYFEFEAPNTNLGNDLYALVQRGDISQCSFAFRVEKDSWKYAEDKELDERELIKISEVIDVALVIDPAYEDTEVSARASQNADFLLKKENHKKQSNNYQAQSQSRARAVAILSLQSKL